MSTPGSYTLKGTPLACHRCGKDRFTRTFIPYHLSLFDQDNGTARPDDINHELVRLRCSCCGFAHRYRTAFVAPAGEPVPGDGVRLEGFR